MRWRWIPIVIVALVVASCGGTAADDTVTLDDLEGHWWLEFWSDGGIDHRTPFPSSLEAARPWIQIGPSVKGNAGCNDFRKVASEHRVEDGRFHPGQIVFTAKLCSSESGDDPMRHERLFQTFLFGRAELGIEVEVEGRRMSWRYGAVSLHFFRIGDEVGSSGR